MNFAWNAPTGVGVSIDYEPPYGGTTYHVNQSNPQTPTFNSITNTGNDNYNPINTGYNPLAVPTQQYVNTAAALNNSYMNAMPNSFNSLNELLSNSPTQLEQNALAGATDMAMNKLIAGKYDTIPGSQGIGRTLGDAVGQYASQMALQREQMWPAIQQQLANGALTSSGGILNAAQSNLTAGQAGSTGAFSALINMLNGTPYLAPAYAAQ